MTYTMYGMELRLKLSKVKFKMNLVKHMVYLFSNIPMLWTHCNWMLVLSQGASNFDVSVSVLLKLQICLRLIDLLVKWLPHACLRSDKWVCWTCLTCQAPHGCPRGQAVLSLTKRQSVSSQPVLPKWAINGLKLNEAATYWGEGGLPQDGTNLNLILNIILTISI